MSRDSEKSLRRKGIYLLPNLFTTAGLFAGFFMVGWFARRIKNDDRYQPTILRIERPPGRAKIFGRQRRPGLRSEEKISSSFPISGLVG